MTAGPPARREPVRIVIADDSTAARAILVEICGRDPEIVVVGEAADGLQAVSLAQRMRPSLVLMDVYMPVLDGIEATKLIMRDVPTPIIMVTAGAEQADVEAGLSALRFGALTVVPKPTGTESPGSDGAARRLVDLVKALADVKVIRRRRTGTPPPREVAPRRRARLVAVAASTGGPPALSRFLQELPADLPAPIVVVQHIVGGFLPGLATWLRTEVPFRVAEAVDGEVLLPGTVYLAPDGSHVEVDAGLRVRLTDAPPVSGFRPSATVLFRSLARSLGADVIGVILTGMGEDGLDGARQLKAAGALVLAQDRQSSVVYGMPRAVAEEGLADVVGPVGQLAAEVYAALMRSPR